MIRRRATACALLLALPLTGCAGDTEGGGTVTVLAASSLSGTFEELATLFESQHPGVSVTFAFDSSATLAEQAAQGAPGDVLATADEATMLAAVDAGVTTAEPERFAENELVIVTSEQNPPVTDLAGLADHDWVMCVETAPCGKVARALLDRAGVVDTPASFEPDVKAVLAKVTSDEADAGLVYATDAVAAELVPAPIEGSVEHRTSYFLAPLEQSADTDLARAWIDLVTSEEGQAVLAEDGFITGPAQ